MLAEHILLAALPFQMPPDRAKSRMADQLSMVLHSSLRFGGEESLEIESPKLFVATYFPAWIISADLEVDMVYKQQKVCRWFFRVVTADLLC